MKQLLSILLSFIILTGQSFAATGIPNSRTWVPIGFAGAGSYSMVLSDNTTANKLYLLSDVNDPWVSTDGAENWTQMPNVGWAGPYTTNMVQSLSNPLKLWATTSSAVLKSLDGGNTWEKMAPYGAYVRGYKYIALDPTNDDHVFIAARGDIYETTDGGTTWNTRVTKPFTSRTTTYTTADACLAAMGAGAWNIYTNVCNNQPPISFVYFDQVQNDLIIGTGKGQAGTTQFGMVRYDLDTNTQSYIDLTGTNAKRNYWYDTYTDGGTKYFCTTAGLKIACTTDYSTWNYTATGTYWDTTYNIEHFVIHKTTGGQIRIIADTFWLASGYVRFLNRSLDFGTTWSSTTKIKASSTINPTNAWGGGGNCFSLTEDFHDENKIYTTTNWAVYVSTDGGSTYNEKEKGAQNTVATDVAVAPDGTEFVTMMDAGIVYREPGSSTWVSAFPNSTYPENIWGGHTWRILTAGTYSDWLAGNGIVVATHTTYQPTKYYWTYILRSTDNGHTFTPILIVDKDLYNGLWSNGYPRGLAMSADQNTMYMSLDGDNCQYNTSLPATCPSSGNPTPSNWITGGIFISRDRGATWARANGHPRITTLYSARRIFNALAVDPTVPSGNTVLFGAFGYQNSWRSKVAASTDTENVETGWGYTSSTDWIKNMKFGSDGVPVVVGSEGNQPVVYRAISTIYGDANGAWGTWQKMITFPNTGIGSAIVIDETKPNWLFVSSVEGGDTKGNRKVWVTWEAKKGNQASWTDITGNLPVNGCNALTINPYRGTSGKLLCASLGGGLLELDLESTTSVHPGKIVIGGTTIE